MLSHVGGRIICIQPSANVSSSVTSRAKALKSINIHDLKHHPGKYQVLHGHVLYKKWNDTVRFIDCKGVSIRRWGSLTVLENLPWILSF